VAQTPRKPYRAIAASSYRVCVLDADYAITCVGTHPTDPDPEVLKSHRITPTGPVRDFAVTEDAIYVIRESGALEVHPPPWPFAGKRTALPPPPAELIGSFDWIHVYQREDGLPSFGCGRSAGARAALVCWEAPDLESPAPSWKVVAYARFASALDAVFFDDGLHYVVGADKEVVRVDPGRCDDSSCDTKPVKGLRRVVRLVRNCAVHESGDVSCMDGERIESFAAVLGRVSSLQPLVQVGGYLGPARHCGLGTDGITRCRVGGTHLCGVTTVKKPGPPEPCRPAEAHLPKATMLAVGIRVCVLSVDGEVRCIPESVTPGSRIDRSPAEVVFP